MALTWVARHRAARAHDVVHGVCVRGGMGMCGMRCQATAAAMRTRLLIRTPHTPLYVHRPQAGVARTVHQPQCLGTPASQTLRHAPSLLQALYKPSHSSPSASRARRTSSASRSISVMCPMRTGGGHTCRRSKGATCEPHAPHTHHACCACGGSAVCQHVARQPRAHCAPCTGVLRVAWLWAARSASRRAPVATRALAASTLAWCCSSTSTSASSGKAIWSICKAGKGRQCMHQAGCTLLGVRPCGRGEHTHAARWMCAPAVLQAPQRCCGACCASPAPSHHEQPSATAAGWPRC